MNPKVNVFATVRCTKGAKINNNTNNAGNSFIILSLLYKIFFRFYINYLHLLSPQIDILLLSFGFYFTLITFFKKIFSFKPPHFSFFLSAVAITLFKSLFSNFARNLITSNISANSSIRSSPDDSIIYLYSSYIFSNSFLYSILSNVLTTGVSPCLMVNCNLYYYLFLSFFTFYLSTQ